VVWCRCCRSARFPGWSCASSSCKETAGSAVSVTVLSRKIGAHELQKTAEMSILETRTRGDRIRTDSVLWRIIVEVVIELDLRIMLPVSPNLIRSLCTMRTYRIWRTVYVNTKKLYGVSWMDCTAVDQRYSDCTDLSSVGSGTSRQMRVIRLDTQAELQTT
jgi:hypothetical protein